MQEGERGKPEPKEALNFSRLQEEHAKVWDLPAISLPVMHASCIHYLIR